MRQKLSPIHFTPEISLFLPSPYFILHVKRAQLLQHFPFPFGSFWITVDFLS